MTMMSSVVRHNQEIQGNRENQGSDNWNCTINAIVRGTDEYPHQRNNYLNIFKSSKIDLLINERDN